MALQGFDKSYYLSAKLAALQATYTEWATKTTTDLETYFTNVGYTAESHYQTHGWSEGLKPNTYFNASEYKASKGKALFDSGYSISIAAGIAAFTAAWTADPYLHYVNYGAFESGVNPSNSFDQNAYYTAKLAALQANTATQADWTGKTVADLRTYFQGAGINPIQHYLAVGTAESLTVAAVTPTAQVSTTAGGSSNPGTTFTLTSGADVVNGTSGDDTISGTLGSLGTIDEIHGSAGTDTLTVSFDPSLATAAATNNAAPVIDGVETITLNARNAASTFNFDNVSGASTVNVGGNVNFTVSAIPNTITAINVNGYTAALTIGQATATATGGAYGLTLNLSASSAADIIYAEDSNSTALVDTLTLNAMTDWNNPSSATNFVGVERLVLKGAGSVNLNMECANGGISADAFTDLKRSATTALTAAGIDASGLSGNLTLRVATADMNIIGGAGADVFIMTADLNTADTVIGGAGTDTLHAVLTGGNIQPNISAVETLNLLVNNTATTAILNDNAGISSVEVLLGSALTLDKLNTSTTTININSSDANGNDLSLQYSTASTAGASDVTLTLGMGTSVLDTATQTASAMAIGQINMSENSGTLTIKADSTAAYSVSAVNLSAITAATINAASGSLSFLSTVGLGTATDTVTLIAAATKGIIVSGAISAMGADTLSFDAAGQSASIDLSAVNVGTANTITITTNSAMTGNVGFSANEFQFQSAAEFTGAIDLDNFTINAYGGDVAIGTAKFLSASGGAASAMNTLFTINMGSTAVAVTMGELCALSIAEGATASERLLKFDINGTGNFTLNSAVISSSNVTISIDAADLASGSNVTIDLSKVDDAGAVGCAVFGANTGSFIGTDGVDNIVAGLGVMTINGGLGRDSITLNNSAAHWIKLGSADAVTAINLAATAQTAVGDFIVGAGTGDVIWFEGTVTAATAIKGGVGYSTGTATDTAQIYTATLTSIAALATAIQTAGHQLAIFTAGGGNTIIQILKNSAVLSAAGTTGITAGDYLQVVLDGKEFTAITAAFQLNTTGSGLSITLL